MSKNVPTHMELRGGKYYSSFSHNGIRVRKPLSHDVKVARILLQRLQGEYDRGLHDKISLPDVPSCVYFVQAASGPIKIGFSEKPTRRLETLSTLWHEKVTLIATIPGTTETESRIHDTFRHIRIRGEWFWPTEELCEYIEKLKGRLKCNGSS